MSEPIIDLTEAVAEVKRQGEQIARLEDDKVRLVDQKAKDDDEFVQATAERDRYRLAWKSAAFRAEARGEGIERIVKDRESYQGWLKQEQAVTERLRAELERRTEDVAFLERATLPELRRTVQHHQDGKQRWRDRAEKAEAELAAARQALRVRDHQLARLRGEMTGGVR